MFTAKIIKAGMKAYALLMLRWCKNAIASVGVPAEGEMQAPAIECC